MVDNIDLIDKFLSKLSERNAMSITANTNYSRHEAEEKLINKFGFKTAGWDGFAEIDGETFHLYHINDRLYAKDNTGTFWNVDSRVIEKEVPEKEGWGYTSDGNIKPVTEYQLNSTVTDPKALEFFKAFDYLTSSERKKLFTKDKAITVKADETERKWASNIIKVEVLNGKFTDPNDYVDDIDDESWSHEDEAIFNLKITVGSTLIFEGDAAAVLEWSGSSETTYYDPGRMYMPNGDPGYPEESAGVVKVNFDDLYFVSLLDEDGFEIELDDIVVKIPAEKLQNMFIKHSNAIIESAILKYLESHCELEVESEW